MDGRREENLVVVVVIVFSEQVKLAIILVVGLDFFFVGMYVCHRPWTC